jgi:surface protein
MKKTILWFLLLLFSSISFGQSIDIEKIFTEDVLEYIAAENDISRLNTFLKEKNLSQYEFAIKDNVYQVTDKVSWVVTIIGKANNSVTIASTSGTLLGKLEVAYMDKTTNDGRGKIFLSKGNFDYTLQKQFNGQYGGYLYTVKVKYKKEKVNKSSNDQNIETKAKNKKENNKIVTKPFITVWKTDNSGGVSQNTEIKFPTTLRLNVEWELKDNAAISGTTTIDSINKIITFPQPGIYILKAKPTTGAYMSFIFKSNEDDDEAKLLEIKQWGDVIWKTMFRAFANCVNMDMTATDVPDLSEVETMERMFLGCYKFVGNGSLSKWDVSTVKNMAHLFGSCYKFDQPIGSWNTSNAINMTNMFGSAFVFNQDISNWKISKVESMKTMFQSASSFNQNLSKWKIAANCDVSYMFDNATAYKGNRNFREGEIVNEKSEYAKINQMKPKTTNQQISKKSNIVYNTKPYITIWNTNNEGYTANNQVKFPGNAPAYKIEWQEKDNAKNKGSVEFSGFGNIITFPNPGIYILKTYTPANGTFMQEYPEWNLGEGHDPNYQLNDSKKLLEVKQWGNIKWSTMKYAFSSCINMDVTATDVPDLSSTNDMTDMFHWCYKLVGNNSFNKWNVSTIEYMYGTFNYCKIFNQPLNNWDVRKVKQFSFMFQSTEIFNQDIKEWNMASVEDNLNMFQYTTSYNGYRPPLKEKPEQPIVVKKEPQPSYGNSGNTKGCKNTIYYEQNQYRKSFGDIWNTISLRSEYNSLYGDAMQQCMKSAEAMHFAFSQGCNGLNNEIRSKLVIEAKALIDLLKNFDTHYKVFIRGDGYGEADIKKMYFKIEKANKESDLTAGW